MKNFSIQKRDGAKSRNLLSTICYLLSAMCSLFIVSCQTVQSPESYIQSGKIPLASGANIYIIADVKEARTILSLLPIPELNNSQTKDMVNRTNFAMAGLYPRESGKRFQMAAWGNYPNAGAGMAFASNDKIGRAHV